MTHLNKGIDTTPLLEFREKVKEYPSNANRNPTVLAEWVGGDQSKISMEGIETYLGGEGYLNPMKMLLACFAACDVDVIAMHASFLGLKIENLSIEASGHFNVQSYLGLRILQDQDMTKLHIQFASMPQMQLRNRSIILLRGVNCPPRSEIL